MKLFKKSLCVVLACLMLCTVMAVGASADEITRISCTMYEDGATGRGFCWYTAEPSGTDLQLITKADYDAGNFDAIMSYTGSTGAFRDNYYHHVAATDLEAGTTYYYRVGDAAQDLWSDICTFTTDNGDNKFSFITIADVQASSDENFAQAAKVMAAALETMPNSEFTVNLGDFVNDNTNDEWNWYFSNFAFANNTSTLVPVAGNHDGNITDKLNTYCFENIFCLDESDNTSAEGVYYAFDYGDAHIVVLNTNDMYPMSQAQQNWIINEMTNTDAKWKIVLMHRSVYAAGKNILKPDTIIMRDILLPIFDQVGVDIVYAGHDHMYLRTNPVYGDAAANYTEISVDYNGVTYTGYSNPEGTVHVLPSTAGTKRYSVQSTLDSIKDNAEVMLSTSDLGGCFATTTIDGDYLYYNAYCVDDDTQEVTEIDSFVIHKEAAGEAGSSDLDQSMGTNITSFFANFFNAIIQMIKSYLAMIGIEF